MKRIIGIVSILALTFIVTACNSNNSENTFEDKKSTHMKELEGAYVSHGSGSLPELNIKELYNSSYIIEGIVKEVSDSEYTEEDGIEMNYTNVVIEVSETLKGNPKDEIVIRRYGGMTELEDGRIFQYFTESPHYTEGEQVLLFLTSLEEKSKVPTGFNADQYFRTVAHGKWESNNGKYVHYIEKDKELSVEEVKNKIK
ncbi:hypothetical protein J2Z40_002131 [Cytobacillus eiseniae]|uniref:Lipoprotein n=1 Tax=Cytobacillus eiseniae TaxID=762947 RepID=A0ABS4RFP1_9BACI|nr:hypothetical protein [Cytobacillus eiseniae]MBP2241568.1 hypothetical protein [Cytobacillus eiseniae]